MDTKMNETNVVDFHTARNSHYLRKQKIEIDTQKYQEFLDGSDLTDKQRNDFMQALWVVMVAFVDLGFGIHPTQRGQFDANHTAEVIELASNIEVERNCKAVGKGNDNV
ncbi:hypothetical protein AB9F26_01045 [Falsihalocynthiibacter sp. BN13B15]|uniref:hypothetical protein n=1 Tax=Falsihalocynthiibacter sp. BN13B15 TaxID=3240871 RepID=UPI00350ED386